MLQDGGALLNTPIPDLINPQVSRPALPNPDMLVLKFDEPSWAKDWTLTGAICDWISGAPNQAATGQLEDRMAAYAAQTFAVPVKAEGVSLAGMKGMVSLHLSDQEKLALQQAAHDGSAQYLKARQSRQVCQAFPSLEDALLALEPDDLNALVEKRNEAAIAISQFRSRSDSKMAELDRQIRKINQTQGELDLNDPSLLGALTALNVLAANNPAKLKWMINRLNRPECASFQQLLGKVRQCGNAIGRPGTAPPSWLNCRILGLAYLEYTRRDVQTIVARFSEAVLYPAYYEFAQTDANRNLLDSTMQTLRGELTLASLRQRLDEAAKALSSRLSDKLSPLNSSIQTAIRNLMPTNDVFEWPQECLVEPVGPGLRGPGRN